MDIKGLKEKKRALGYTNEDVARLSGIPLGTVQKVFAGVTKRPRRDTVIALAKVLDPDMAVRLQSNDALSSDVYFSPSSDTSFLDASRISEAETAYNAYYSDVQNYDPDKERVARLNSLLHKKQGEYTIEDYNQLPDDIRVELIDGRIYFMTAPLLEHQLTAGEIYYQLKNCAEKHAMPCTPAIAPVDVQLDRDEKTMLQPDVMILCEEDLLQRKGVYGAPEFVLEVLSRSTRGKDQIIKLQKYKEAGCKEYWIVDIENRRVLVYIFENENWPEIYSFSDRVPVSVSDGLYEIDFSKVDAEIQKAQRF